MICTNGVPFSTIPSNPVFIHIGKTNSRVDPVFGYSEGITIAIPPAPARGGNYTKKRKTILKKNKTEKNYLNKNRKNRTEKHKLYK